MAKRNPRPSAGGFSLVEMLVALVFTGLLMAGMSQVFKASLSSFYTSGEALSTARRNRMSMDLLYDDLNTAGMYLGDLTAPPTTIAAGNPAFYIIPNQPVPGAGADDPPTADELYLYLDQPLSFEGSITPAGDGAALMLAKGDPATTVSSFTVDCTDPAFANQVKVGQQLVLKDFFETLQVASVSLAGKVATITVAPSAMSGITGSGPSQSFSKYQHNVGARTLFFSPQQMVRYSIQMMNLDPQVPAGIPCLVRDQGTYTPAGFVADPALQSIVTESVQAFKVYLSVDSGKTWAGEGQGYAGFAAGWTNGIRADLNATWNTAGSVNRSTELPDLIKSNEQWFRKTGALVRVDVTTRSATKRTEYSATPTTTTAYKNITKSLVLVPRHFGLPIN